MIGVRAFAVLALLLACRGESRERPAPAPEPADRLSPARASGGPEPVWLIHVPDTPGMPVLETAAGPVLAGDLVLVASSAIGFAAVDRATGALRWQRRGEEQPQRPIVRGTVALLPGRCAAVIDEAPADQPVAGCVDEVELHSGELRQRRWVVAPGPAPRPRVLGAEGEHLIWGAEGVVWIDRGAPVVIARQAEGAAPLAVTRTDTGAIVIWRHEVQVVARDQDGGYRHVARRTLPDRVLRGVTDPLPVDGMLAVVIDDELQGWRPETGEVAWRAPVRVSFAPGSVTGGATVRAIGLDGGIHVVEIDPSRGAVVREGERQPALQALSARFETSGALLASVRPTVSLLRDQVMSFDAAGQHRWTWDVPEPTAPRLDPVGVDGDGRDAFVFYDGRELARLPVAAP
jgi:hypothetical protein